MQTVDSPSIESALAAILATQTSILQALADANDLVIGKVVSGTPNSVLTTFYVMTGGVAEPFVANSEELKVNGVTQIRNVHYVPTGSLGRFVFETAYIPETGYLLTANYRKA
jgi:hypothetical protein